MKMDSTRIKYVIAKAQIPEQQLCKLTITTGQI